MANPFQIRITALDLASKTVKSITKSLGGFTTPVGNASKAIKKLGQTGLGSFKELGKGLRDISASAGNAVRMIGGLSAVGVIVGLAALADRFGNFGFALNRTSKLIGMNAQDLAAWHVAAERAGVSAEAFDQAMSNSQDVIRAAEFGKDPHALVILEKMGVQIAKNTDGSIDYLTTQQRIFEAIKKQKSIPAQREVANTFGMSALLPMIQQNTYVADRARAARSGLIPTPAEIARADAFWHNVTDLRMSISGLGNAIGSQIIPIIEPLVTGFSQWLNENRVRIAREFAAAVQQFANWLNSVNWDTFLAKAKEAWDKIDGFKGVLKIIAGLTLVGPIAAVSGLAVALASLGGFFVLNPIGLAVAAVATLGVAGYELYENWDKVQAWWHNLWATMAGDAKEGTEKINDSKHDLSNPGANAAAAVRNSPIDLGLGKFSRWMGNKAAQNPQTPYVVQYLMGRGMNKNAAIAMAANFWQESTFDPGAIGDSGKSYGVGQWDATRQADFKRLMGKDIRGSKLEDQLDFAVLEMQKGGDAGARRASAAMALTDSPGWAARVYSKYAERPKKEQAEMDLRESLAVGIARELGENFGTATTAAPDAAPTPAPQAAETTAPAADAGRDAQTAELQHSASVAALQQQAPQPITVIVNNALPGTSVEAKGADNATMPTRINYSMGASMGAMP
ncbi:hypothetical protein B0G84_5742 [Paraburkholderia sp. BL8N3]|nr:phage tail tip lysozyme [Paraburkholderia sp. BL8N3]TCK36729.1 hypothetical protein B0G84_5742 [Paraburkholderia sp. BL8N3]